MYIKDPHPLLLFFIKQKCVVVFGVLIRVLVYPFGEIIVDWGKILIILSVFSMLIGSLGALKQDDLKRLMAYKTINHIGFILMGLTSQGLRTGLRLSVYI